MRILISGAGIAGPVLAYWLVRQGFSVTFVERAPGPRKTGGHAVDLFRPAMAVSAKMGLLSRIDARTTGTRLALFPEGRRRARARGSVQDLRCRARRACRDHARRSERDLLRRHPRRCRVPVRRLDHGDLAGR
ncbi:FAD-dependent oxidoreductase [Nocardia sp. NPDC001965]